MSDAYQRYRSGEAPVPAQTWTWNMYGAGLENIGHDGKPERFDVPAPAVDQLLVRVDAVGMCFSDVKLIKQGNKHPQALRIAIWRASPRGSGTKWRSR